MNIFKLVGTVFVDTEKANESLSKTDKEAGSVGTTLLAGAKKAGKFAVALGAATAAGSAALMGVATKAAGVTDNIDKMSQKIGISRQAYQELDFITSQCGASVDGLKAGMKTLTNQMQMANEGSTTAVAAFDALGLSWTDGTGKLKDQETMMWEAFTALQSCEDQTKKAALASDLFGKAGTELMPMLNGASGSIEEMKKKAHELGLVLDDEAIDSGVVFTDTVDQAKRSLSTLGTEIGVSVMPIIHSGLDYLIANMPQIKSLAESAFNVLGTVISIAAETLVGLIGFVDEHKVQLIALGAVIGTVAVAYGAYNAVTALKTALDIKEAATIGAVTAALWAKAAAMAAALAPYLLITAAIAAVIAIGVLLYKNWDKIKEKAIELFNKLKDVFGKIKERVVEKIEGMKAAVVNKFVALKENVAEKVEGIKNSVVNKFNAIKDGIVDKIDTARATVKGIIDKIKGFFDFKVSLPNIKLPHFDIQPAGWKIGDLLKGEIPKLGIKWYKKAMNNAMVLDKPTIFGASDENLLGGGEAGREIVSGEAHLEKLMKTTVASENAELKEVLVQILSAIVNMDDNMGTNLKDALTNMPLEVNKREFGRLVRGTM